MKMLKVLQVIPSFGMGGAEKVVLNYLAYNQSDAMHLKAVSLYPKQNSIYDKEIEKKQYDVEYLNKKKGMDLSVVKQLKKVIVEYQPDIIHTHLYALKYLMLTGEMKHRKIFHTIHNEPEKDVGKLDEMINRYLFKKRSVHPIALQDQLAISVNQFYGIENTSVIKNGICLCDFKRQGRLTLTDLEIPENAYTIGHIGRFSKQKNHKFILKVFADVLSKNKDAYLILVGSGEDEQNIRTLASGLHIEKHIRFLGNRSDIADLLQLMNVFIFPSIFEGLGIVLVEAQAAGIPCVISENIPDEVMLTEKIEKLSLNLSVDKWSEKLLNPELIHNDKIYEELNNYDISKTMIKLEMLYRDNQNE